MYSHLMKLLQLDLFGDHVVVKQKKKKIQKQKTREKAHVLCDLSDPLSVPLFVYAFQQVAIQSG